jgi:hypothetical protein
LPRSTTFSSRGTRTATTGAPDASSELLEHGRANAPLARIALAFHFLRETF